MIWWIASVIVVVGAPIYLYLLCKYAGAGWYAGQRFINRRRSR